MRLVLQQSGPVGTVPLPFFLPPLYDSHLGSFSMHSRMLSASWKYGGLAFDTELCKCTSSHTWLGDSVSVSEMPTRPAIRWQKCIFLLRNCSRHLIAGPWQWKMWVIFLLSYQEVEGRLTWVEEVGCGLRKECFWSERSVERMQSGILKFLTHTILGHWLPSWIPFSHLRKLEKFRTATVSTATRRYPSFFNKGNPRWL